MNFWIRVAGTLLHFTFHLTSLWKHELLQIHHLSICTQAGLPMKSFCTHIDLFPFYSGKEWLNIYKNECLLHEMEKKTKQHSTWKISPNCVRVVTHITNNNNRSIGIRVKSEILACFPPSIYRQKLNICPRLEARSFICACFKRT